MSALFIVRAQMVDPAARDDFDRWYQDEHLPDALKAFNARRAWRGWSDVDTTVHYAFYEFDDLAGVQAIQGSDALKGLVAEFDRLWEGRVTRTRDIVPDIQQLRR
jgi:hypothetical protein